MSYLPFEVSIYHIKYVRGLMRQCYDCMKHSGCCNLQLVKHLQLISKAPFKARKALIQRLGTEDLCWFFPKAEEIVKDENQ